MIVKRRPLITATIALSLSGLLLLAACGGGDDANKRASSASPQAMPNSAEAQPTPALGTPGPEAPVPDNGVAAAGSAATTPDAQAPGTAATAAPDGAKARQEGASSVAATPKPNQAQSATASPGGGKSPGGQGTTAPAQLQAPTPAPAGGNGGATDVGVTGDSVKFGGIYAMGYPLADVLWKPMIRLQEAFFRIVNDTGGIYGRKLNFAWCDDGFPDAGRTRACYKKLVEQDKIFAFANGCTWNEDQYQADMQKEKVPAFTPCSLYSVEWRNPFAFPIHMDMRQEGLAIADWILKNKHAKTYGVLCKEDMPDSQAACNNVQKGMEAGGAKMVYKGQFRTGTPDMSSDILAARAANPDILVDFVIDPSITARFMVDAAQQNYWPPMGYTANHKTTEVIGGLIGDYPAKKGFVTQTSYLLWGGEFIAWSNKYAPGNKGMNNHVTQGEYFGNTAMIECMRRVGPNLTRAGHDRLLQQSDVGVGSRARPAGDVEARSAVRARHIEHEGIPLQVRQHQDIRSGRRFGEPRGFHS